MLLFLSRRHFKLRNSAREHDRLILSAAAFLLNVAVCVISETWGETDKPSWFLLLYVYLESLRFSYCQLRLLLLPSWRQFQQFAVAVLTTSLNPLSLVKQCALSHCYRKQSDISTWHPSDSCTKELSAIRAASAHKCNSGVFKHD